MPNLGSRKYINKASKLNFRDVLLDKFAICFKSTCCFLFQKYPITEYQPVYFASDSFESAKRKLQDFCKLIPRPFAVRYNPYTESVEVIDNKDKLLQMASEMQGELLFEILKLPKSFDTCCKLNGLLCNLFVDRASSTETVDLGSIPGRVKPKTTKIAIHSFLA